MPASSAKVEYWCLFKGDQFAFVQEFVPTDNNGQFVGKIHKLLEQDDVIVYCAEIPESHPAANEVTFLPFKKALDKIESKWYTIATKAYAILNWDKNHQFCGRCGTPLHNRPQAHEFIFERECPNCHLLFYPRISPSIIVRIRKDDQILMARSPHFPPGVYGLIAGFVEAGESLEQAVHREVQEEVGIQITNLRYIKSQPWPFPDSLMVAFTADYLSGELVIDKNEIEAAGWYHRDNLPGRPSTRISIANQLIEDFVNGII